MLKRKLMVLGIALCILGLGMGTSQAKVTYVLTFEGHTTYALNQYALTPKMASLVDKLVAANKDAVTWGLVGYAHRLEIGPPGADGSPGSPMTLSAARAEGVRAYMAAKYPNLKLKAYAKGVKPNDMSEDGPRVVSIYAQKPVGKPDPPGPSISGTFTAVAGFSVDDVYVTRVSAMGPVKRMAKFPLDAIDGDTTEKWKLVNLKPGRYNVKVTMVTKQDGTCLSISNNSADGQTVYGGKAKGFVLDPTDEFCAPRGRFFLTKTVTVRNKPLTGQDFTLGLADILN